MSDTLPPVNLPAVTVPELSGPLTKPSRGSLSSEMDFSPHGMAIRTLEQGMQVAQYLVTGKAAPKDWTAAQVFLAMQAGMEHGLGYTGGIQSFVIINNMPSWRGQAAIGKIRASRVLEPGSLEFGCDEVEIAEGKTQLRGWARAKRVGDTKVTERFFTQQEAVEAGLWSKGDNWTKFKRRMLMWRAVGFLTKDLFSDVLGNFPIAEELLFQGRPDDNIDVPIQRAVSQLTGATDEPARDSLLDELAPAVTVPATAPEETDKTGETDSPADSLPLTEEEIQAKAVADHEAELEKAEREAIEAPPAEDSFLRVQTKAAKKAGHGR